MKRVLVVAQALASSRRGVPLKTLAERHGWKLRNLYRDIDTLEAAGFPITREQTRYKLMDGWSMPFAGRVEPDELLALFLARQLAAGWKATSLGRSLDRLWSKVTAAAAGRTTPLMPEDEPWAQVRSPLAIDYGQHRETIATLEQAIRERIAVDCRYLALSSGQLSARVIEPAELYWDPGLETLYAIAYCRLREDLRVFAVHRFRMVALTGERFRVRPGISSRTALKNAFRVYRSSHVERVVVEFSARVAAEIRERVWHPSQQLSDGPGGTVRMTLEVAGTAEVERWVLGFGRDARALAPPELVARVHEQLEDARAQYAEPARRTRRPAPARRRKFDRL